MKFKAVIFDLDGTLLNTLADLADSANAMLESRGYPVHPIDSYQDFIGEGARKLLARILPEGHRDAATISACHEIFTVEYKKRYADSTRPYSGVREMLFALQAKALPLAVYSNKPHPATVRCVETLLPREVFSIVIGLREGMPPKPDPGGALEIAKVFGVSPRECFYLGDTKTDMETAVAAGMYPAGALWGFRTREELLAAGAKTLLDKPADILPLF